MVMLQMRKGEEQMEEGRRVSAEWSAQTIQGRMYALAGLEGWLFHGREGGLEL